MTLFEWREKKGLSQQEAARRIGVDPSMLSKWERGVVFPNIQNAVEILRLTEGAVTLAELAKKGPGGR